MKIDSLNPDALLYETAVKLFGEKDFPEIEYRCDIFQREKGDISSPWAFSLVRVLPGMTPETLAVRLAAAIPHCQADKGFLNFTFDLKVLDARIETLRDRFLFYLQQNEIQVVLDDKAENFLPAYFLYRGMSCRRNMAFAAEKVDFTAELQRRAAVMVAWCDILYEKKQRNALFSAIKLLAEQIYIWDRSSREDVCHSKLFGAAGYFFSLCV